MSGGESEGVGGSDVPAEMRETVEAMVRGMGGCRGEPESLRSLRSQLVALIKHPDAPTARDAFPNPAARYRFHAILKTAIAKRALVHKTLQPCRKALYDLQSRQLNALATEALKTDQERLRLNLPNDQPTLSYERTNFSQEQAWKAVRLTDRHQSLDSMDGPGAGGEMKGTSARSVAGAEVKQTVRSEPLPDKSRVGPAQPSARSEPANAQRLRNYPLRRQKSFEQLKPVGEVEAMVVKLLAQRAEEKKKAAGAMGPDSGAQDTKNAEEKKEREQRRAERKEERRHRDGVRASQSGLEGWMTMGSAVLGLLLILVAPSYGSMLCLLAGLVYPGWKTMGVVGKKRDDEWAQWAGYWMGALIVFLLYHMWMVAPVSRFALLLVFLLLQALQIPHIRGGYTLYRLFSKTP